MQLGVLPESHFGWKGCAASHRNEEIELLLHPSWYPPCFCFMLFFYSFWGIGFLYRVRCSYILALAEALLSFLSVCCQAVHCVCRWWVGVFRGKWTSCCISFCFFFFFFFPSNILSQQMYSPTLFLKWTH